MQQSSARLNKNLVLCSRLLWLLLPFFVFFSNGTRCCLCCRRCCCCCCCCSNGQHALFLVVSVCPYTFFLHTNSKQFSGSLLVFPPPPLLILLALDVTAQVQPTKGRTKEQTEKRAWRLGATIKREMKESAPSKNP